MSLRRVNLAEEMGLNRQDSLARLEVGTLLGSVDPAWYRYNFVATGYNTGWRPFDWVAASKAMREVYEPAMTKLFADPGPSPFLGMLERARDKAAELAGVHPTAIAIVPIKLTDHSEE